MELIKSSLGIKLILAGVFFLILYVTGIFWNILGFFAMVGFTFSGIIVYAIERNKTKK